MLVILLLGILFWIIYYYFEGSHDGIIANEVKLLRNSIEKKKFNSIEDEFVKYELGWHLFDSLEKGLVKIVLSIFIYLITENILFSIQMFLLAIGIRSFAHDLFVTIKMGKGLDHIGPDFLWWDRFLRKMQHLGINQYIIKFIPNALLIIWILFTI